ncbi:MAG: SprB repeat-containing protein, partial [Saprospiraceae bacterium]|nr:SprB repeat-containing protein [Saprospiraceae bacterium]
MKTVKRSRLLPIVGLMLSILTWLANSNNPPTGRTGAPFDGNCNNCHSGGSFNGTVEVGGMPATVEPNTVYPLTITLTPTAGSPIRGGFQLVSVDANNALCGNLAPINAQTGTEMAGGREYIEHRGAKTFPGGGPATWDFNWTSPGIVPGNTVKFYFIGNFCNGNNNDSGDIAFSFLETYPFSGPPPLAASINDIDNVSCFGGNNGSATVTVSGGIMPYTYLWNNGQTGATANNLTAGNYSVTVTGAQSSGTTIATTTISQPLQLNATVTTDGSLSCANPEVELTVSASGGTPNFNYVWSNGESGNPLVVSSGGTYTVTVTDNNNCTKTASA